MAAVTTPPPPPNSHKHTNALIMFPADSCDNTQMLAEPLKRQVNCFHLLFETKIANCVYFMHDG